MKNSYRHSGNKGGGAVAGANNNYFFLVINLYNNNNNNHFRTERTDINRYGQSDYGIFLLTLDHTHSQVPRPTPSKIFIFMENPLGEEFNRELDHSG